MPFVPVDKPALRGNDALSCAKNGDACRQLLGRRLQPTLLKSKTRSPPRALSMRSINY